MFVYKQCRIVDNTMKLNKQKTQHRPHGDVQGKVQKLTSLLMFDRSKKRTQNKKWSNTFSTLNAKMATEYTSNNKDQAGQHCEPFCCVYDDFAAMKTQSVRTCLCQAVAMHFQVTVFEVRVDRRLIKRTITPKNNIPTAPATELSRALHDRQRRICLKARRNQNNNFSPIWTICESKIAQLQLIHKCTQYLFFSVNLSVSKNRLLLFQIWSIFEFFFGRDFVTLVFVKSNAEFRLHRIECTF